MQLVLDRAPPEAEDPTSPAQTELCDRNGTNARRCQVAQLVNNYRQEKIETVDKHREISEGRKQREKEHLRVTGFRKPLLSFGAQLESRLGVFL